MDTMVDYYKILDVPQSASMNEIKRAYRSKVLRWHPDKNPENRKEAEQKFKEIVEAYKILSDKSTRDHYDGSSKDSFKGTKRSETEKHLSVFDQDGIKIFFTGRRCSSDFSVSFFSAPKRFHHFSIMSAVMNGKKITTKRHLENESKYLEVEEDGKTVSIHVNGIPIYDRESNSPTGNEWDYRLDKGHCCPDKWHLWTCERRRWADEWRLWANKWRDWAEECRDWAEGRYHQQDKASTKIYAGHHRTDAAEHPKASEEHPRSDRGCPKARGKFPGFPTSQEGKCDLKEGHSKTGKGQSWLEEECSRTDKGYFVFPKPGEKNSVMDEGHLKTNKKQHRLEEGQPLLDKSNPGFSRPGEGYTDQDEGHGRTKKGQPRPEEGQSKLDKVHHGLQKPEQGSPTQKKTDPECIESPMKHKAVSEYNSQSGNMESHIEKQEQQPEEIPRAVKNQNTLGKSELKDEKLEPKGDKSGSTLESEPEKGTGLSGMRKKSSAYAKLEPKAQFICGATGLLLKRKEAQIQTRKPYTKRSKSRAERNRSYSKKSKSHAGKIRNDSSSGGREEAPDGKKTPIDCKCAPQSKKEGLLPPSQEGETPLLIKKRLLRRRAHHPSSETQVGKQASISETSQLLDIKGQRRGRVIKLPRPSAQLPSIRDQKFGVNQLPNVTR